MNMVVSHWSASLLALAVLVAAALHLLGLRGLAAGARRKGERLPDGLVREAAVFYLGLLAVLLALVSPVAYWAQRFVWVRSVQDVLLAIVAPALIVLGAPWLALRRGVRYPRQEPETAAAEQEQALGWLRMSIAVTVAFNLAWCGWHLPVLYDAARPHGLVFACEAITYLGCGVLFWCQLIGSRPHVPRLAPLRRVTLLVGTAAIGAGFAMVLVFGSEVLYPSYLSRQHGAVSLVADQQVGGAVLWVLPLVPYFVAMVALLVRWLNDEESADMATGFDRLLNPARSGWTSWPGLRSPR
jgi:cytochrome c oxidase assembly factor CtaG